MSEPLIMCESCGRVFTHKDIIACTYAGRLSAGPVRTGTIFAWIAMSGWRTGNDGAQ